LACTAAEASPGLTVEKALWEMPFCMLGFLVMQAMRKRGVKGIGRPEISRQIWENFQKEQKNKK